MGRAGGGRADGAAESQDEDEVASYSNQPSETFSFFRGVGSRPVLCGCN